MYVLFFYLFFFVVVFKLSSHRPFQLYTPIVYTVKSCKFEFLSARGFN